MHLAAMQNVEDDLAEAYDVHAAMTLAQVMELQGPLNRFNALADRMVAIVDYLAHTTPHLPPAAFAAEGQSQHDHFGGGMGAEDHGTAQGSEAGQPRQANREVEPATDEVDGGADGNSSSAGLGQGQEEHFGTAATSEDRDNGGAWAQAEDYEEARELYLEKLETLHRLMRKVHAIKARTSTAGHDPLPEIDHLDALYREEEERVGGGWLLADLDYDEFQDETQHTPGSGAYSSADAGRRRLAVIQRELTRLTSLPKSEGRERRMQELTDELLEMWGTGKYTDYFRVVSFSLEKNAARNATWGVAPEGEILVEFVDGVGDQAVGWSQGEGEGDYDDEDEDEEDNLWF